MVWLFVVRDELETSNLPEIMVVPASWGMMSGASVNCTSPEGVRLNPVSTPSSCPVSSVGKSTGLIPTICPPLSLGGAISKLNRCPD